ncbi:carboxymuconolactone decarboxylase family protein [Actinomycetospora sp. OC33-EN08]|uniref:Carboxymuconolactone decarboxylase family protein n=1 Tax=Actinomycetospora aurantiaca TaxID=3129233 RepID=A0ABU8MTM6_9PSEU
MTSESTPDLEGAIVTGTSADDRYARGLEILRVVGGQDPPAVVGALGDLAPDMARYTVEFAYGDIYARPGLTWRERQLLTVAALTALGTADAQLRFHIRGALTVGATAREVVETITHACLYAGFPATLNGLTAARAVFVETDHEVEHEPGNSPTESRWDRGWSMLTTVDGGAGERVVASLEASRPTLRAISSSSPSATCTPAPAWTCETVN